MSRSVPKLRRLDKPASATSYGLADSPIGFLLGVWQDNMLVRLALLPADAEKQSPRILDDLDLPSDLKRSDAATRKLVNDTLFPNKRWTGIFTAANSPVMGFYGTDFQWSAMNHMLRIPAGKTVSYHALAGLAGSENASRAAGSVCARNPIPFIIPCHRILATNGGLGGYAFGTALKRELLRLEKSIS